MAQRFVEPCSRVIDAESCPGELGRGERGRHRGMVLAACDRRALSSTDAGLAFLPFTLGVGLLSNPFGGLADRIGARAMLVAGPAGAALAYILMALGREQFLMLGVIGPMTLLGLSFAVLEAPLTASVMSSVD
jgi:MFS family permease